MDQTKKLKTKEKKKVFTPNISTNSGFHLKNFAIFHEFWGKDQKQKGLRPKMYAKFYEILYVSPQKLRKNSSCLRILGR